MSDYLSDREQEEILRNWLRDNWRWMFGAVVLALVAIVGSRSWESYKTRRAEQAAAVFAEYRAADNEESRKSSFSRLVSEFKRSPYVWQARLLEAKAYVDAGKYEEAASELRAVVAEAKDDELVQVARLRLARVLIQLGNHDEALRLLKPESAGAFAAQVREVRGDALYAKGDSEGARAEYAAALAAGADALTDRSLLEMKLQQTGGAVADARTP